MTSGAGEPVSSPPPTVAARFLASRRAEVDAVLEKVLALDGVPSPLAEAMRYSVKAGGKRVRPLVGLAVFESLGGPDRRGAAGALEALSALELVHTYSLIHDDLPCMDDDSLRRGRPTCHVVHGEAMALLAGDALQALGFEVLATFPLGAVAAPLRAEAVAVAARAIGAAGMAGGQALDLLETGHGARGEGAAGRLRRVHALKTGRLLSASAEIGAVLGGEGREARERAACYGEALGLVFQIADDLLDVTSDASTLGKTAGKDAKQEKLTYPAVFGLAGARQALELSLDEARRAARSLGGGANGLLESFACWAAARDR